MSDGSTNAGNVALTVSTTTGVGMGVMSSVNEYAVLIGMSISVLSILIGLYFQIRTVMWRNKLDAKERAELRAEILKELNDHK